MSSLPPLLIALPSDCPGVRFVESFEELANAEFTSKVNALCWRRVLPGDFAEVAALLAPGMEPGITSLEDEELEALPASPAGRLAIQAMLDDARRLRCLDLEPCLDFIDGTRRDRADAVVPTDVFSFHADSATAQADTWLCAYHGPSTEGLRNDQAIRRVDQPATRAALLAEHGGPDDAAFAQFLAEHCYDLHYAPLPGAQPFAFGSGNLWRIAVAWPGSPAQPCIHRAPEPPPGAGPRLLLIS